MKFMCLQIGDRRRHHSDDPGQVTEAHIAEYQQELQSLVQMSALWVDTDKEKTETTAGRIAKFVGLTH